MKPLWTVIIPVYNRLTYLRECLESVLRQAPPPEQMEILVCDDHSSLDIASSVESWGRQRVQFHSHSKNRGQWPNVNAAVGRAQGEWIHILHDDDFVLPGFYQNMETAMRSASDSVGVLVCGCVILDQARQQTHLQPALQEAGGILANWLGRVAVRNPVNLPAVVVRRTVYAAIGNYCEKIPYCADWDFHVRAAQHFDWWFVPQPLACYRIHDDSVTTRLSGQGLVARDIRRTLERSAQSLSPTLRRIVLSAACPLHARNFSAEAANAFHRGDSGLGYTLLRQALALARLERLASAPTGSPTRVFLKTPQE